MGFIDIFELIADQPGRGTLISTTFGGVAGQALDQGKERPEKELPFCRSQIARLERPVIVEERPVFNPYLPVFSEDRFRAPETRELLR